MTTLHTVNKSCLSANAFLSCLKVALPGDCVLLIEDGVYNAVTPSSNVVSAQERHTDIRFCVLAEDLQARGIQSMNLPAHVDVVTYEDFVELTCAHARCVSWF